MNLPAFSYFLGVLLLYVLAAAIASLLPAFALYRLYHHRMKKYQEVTGLNPYRIPFNLRKLIVLAKKWGIEDNAKRRQTIQEASPQERLELSKTIMGKDELIYRWLSTFTEETVSPEAKAYAWMMRSIEKMNLIVQESSQTDYTDFREQPYNNASFETIIKHRPIIRNRVRVIKLNSCVSLPVLIVSFIGYFILFGKLWSLWIPDDPNSSGLVVINCLSGAASVFTWALITSIAKVIRIPGIEVRS